MEMSASLEVRIGNIGCVGTFQEQRRKVGISQFMLQIKTIGQTLESMIHLGMH